MLDVLPVRPVLTWSDPAGRSDKPVTGLLAKLLSGQIRSAGARHGAAPGPVDRSNEGHRGHTLTWVRPGRCCDTMMLTDLPTGRRVVGPGVLLLHPQAVELGLE